MSDTMKRFGEKKLSALLSALPEAEYRGEDVTMTGICVNSARIQPGELFVCLCGQNHNGHDYIGEAKDRGACGVVISEARDTLGLPAVTVPDTRDAFARLWDAYCGYPSRDARLRIVAVTGTNGKTTTAHMLKSIFDEAGYRTAVIGTVTGDMTTPDPDVFYPKLAELIADGTEYLFMEASSHALALKKLAPITFEAGVFLNLTPEHLDFHGDMVHYREAKGALFAQSRLSVLNVDDGSCGYMIGAARRAFGGVGSEIRTFSTRSDEADYTAKNGKCFGAGGIRYDFLTQNRLFRVDCPIPGSFTIQNSLAAASCAYALGVPYRTVMEALRKMKGVPGRMERLVLYCGRCGEQGFCGSERCADDKAKRLDYRALTVLIDYAHTPDALEKLLRNVRSFRSEGQRIILLFGCGGDRDKSKRPVMGAIASRLSDLVIVTGDNSRTEDPEEIIRQILRGIDKERPYKVIPDRKEAIEYAVRTAEDGDILVLAGKGHETYEISSEGKRHFDEREIVRLACEACGR